MKKYFYYSVLTYLLLSVQAYATTYYVKTNGNDTQNGQSWGTAFQTLQKALSTATTNDQIWLAQGTYYPDEGPGQTDNDRTAAFSMKNGVAIYGGFSGNGTETMLSERNWTTNLTTLSGELQQDNAISNNSYHVIFNNFTLGTPLTNTAIIDGFIITGGNANNSSPLEHNNGGGMYNQSSSPTVTNCRFIGNKTGAYGAGAGMENYDNSSPVVTNCAFLNNDATYGGGVDNYNSSNPTFKNCIFSGNKASNGGGMANRSASPTLINCTFSGNRATAGTGGGLYNDPVSPVLRNCIIWGNSTEIYNTSSTPTYTHCLIQGENPSGTGNLDGTNPANNPLFITQPNFNTAPTAIGNLRLRPCSPAANMGNNADNSTSTDLDENSRTAFSTIDLGAYELQSTTSNLILYVKTNGDDTKDGQSWGNAFKTLQKALQYACSGDQIWVAQGTYYPDEGAGNTNNNLSAAFTMKNGVAIYGGFVGTEPTNYNLASRNFVTNETILSGEIQQDNDDSNNSEHVIYNNFFSGSPLATTAILNGFTVKKGGKVSNFFNYKGGGMYNKYAHPTITNCLFSDNKSDFGGGVYNDNSSPTLTDCRFLRNEATVIGGGIHNYNTSSNPILTRCTFSENKALNGAGAGNEYSKGTYIHCSFIQNEATQSGGGMYSSGSGTSPTLTNCFFNGNSTVNSTGGYYGGGGMSSRDASPQLTNCAFSGNKATNGEGGGIHFYNSPNAILTNCSISGNYASYYGGGIRNITTTLTLTNCIVWGNGANPANEQDKQEIYGDVPTYNYSLIKGLNPSGMGNLDGTNLANNPLFITQPDFNAAPTTTGDLRLQGCSPALNQGDNNADLDGTGSGTATISSIANDLAGSQRIFNSIVDLGAYEYQANLLTSTINAPTVTQPTCTTPTGTIVVNATSSNNGVLEYSINDGNNWQTNATFSGLAPGNYILKVRFQATPACINTYAGNPVVLISPFTVPTTTDTWTGCVSTNWGTPGNWQDGTVPTATDDVIIPNVTNDPIIGAAAVAKSVTVQSGAVLTNNSTLTINGSATQGMLNNGTVHNNGTLAIGNTSSVGQYGLYNQAIFNNNNNGHLTIDRAISDGLVNDNSGTVTNLGTIDIGGVETVGSHGIRNQANFDNNAGQININRAGRGLLHQIGTFNNAAGITIGGIGGIGDLGLLNLTTGTFNNNSGGQIKIDNSTFAGIINQGTTFNNAGMLTIGSVAAVGAYGLQNNSNGTFNNNAGGEINIDRSTTTGLDINSGSFTNLAKITIGAAGSVGTSGINNTGTFNNNGCRSLINIVSNNIISNTGTFTNEGIIIENASGNSSITGNTGVVQNLNDGTFNITNGNAAIASTGDIWIGCTSTDWATAGNWLDGSVPTTADNVVIQNVINAPTIAAATTAVAQSVEVQTGATLTIAASAMLTINGSKSYVNRTTAFYNNGTVENNGQLILGNTAAVGTHSLYNLAVFNNNSGAEITIDRSDNISLTNGGTFTNRAKITLGATVAALGYSIRNLNSFDNKPGGEIKIDHAGDIGLYHANGIFTNEAKITIGATASGGDWGLTNDATFNNNPGGEITIDRFTELGLSNGGGTFTNRAKITIGATGAVGIGLRNTASFDNAACAVLTLFYPLKNESSFTNTGLFTLNTAQAHTNSALTNDGIIEYPQGNPIPNVTNNDVIVAPIAVCGTSSLTPALQLGGANSFTVGTNWYKENTLTTVAGIYTPNTFTVTNLTAGSTYPLYFTVTDPANSCSRTVSISTTVKALPVASIVNTNSPICAGSNATFTVSGTNGAILTYTLTGVMGNQTLVLNGSNQIITATGVSANATLALVSVSKDNCDVSLSTTAMVTVTPLPTATITYAGSPFCQSLSTAAVTLTGTNAYAGGTYSSTTGLTINPATGEINPSTSTAGTYLITYTIAPAGGCTTVTATASVTLHPLPIVTIAGTTTVCQNAPSPLITFTGSHGTAPYTFTYTLNQGGTQTVITSSGNSVSISPSTANAGVFTYSLVSVSDVNCSQNQTGSVIVNVLGKPSITLNVLGQTLNEGNTQVLCDTDANPSNALFLNVTTACVSGVVQWRTQIGAGSWSAWSNIVPITQPSDNTGYRYQAACDPNCASTFSGIITLTINYRASTPQNVSLVADGTTVVAGESKIICNLDGNTLAFNASCAAGEIVLYSVDGADYSSNIPSQIVDNAFHNYRVRCRKADGAASCVETESAVMSLKITTSGPAPTVSISPLSSCGSPTTFSGSSTCGALNTVWYNAATNQALPTLPTTTPNATTSYYARCQNEAACLSEPSNVVTFTILPVNDPPTVSVSSDVVCTGTAVTISANCPAGSNAFWNTGVNTNSFQVAFNNVTKQTYWAKCIFSNGCQSPESTHTTVFWKAFELTLINIGQSQSAIKPANDRNLWTNQFITRDAGPVLDNSTQSNPTLYYTESPNKGGPRYWTIQVETCALGTDGSVTYDLLAAPEAGVPQSFNTHENNAPYLMYANREGFTELYAQNHPAYGFYQNNGSGGNTYDTGLPKGLYKLGIRYWDQKGQGSIYPATRRPAGNVLAYQEYWFRIQSQSGIGAGAARTALNNDQLSDRRTSVYNAQWTEVAPNPVSQTLHLKISGAKGQKVGTSLMDASGRMMLQRAFVPQTDYHQEEFEVSQLANGIYFLQVKTVDKQTTLKVVKIQ